MDLLPNEREDIGLQTVFTSVFPISDFRWRKPARVRRLFDRQLECKCGNLKGLHHLRSTCRNPSCGATIKTDPFHPATFCARFAALSTETSSPFVTSAAIRWACS